MNVPDDEPTLADVQREFPQWECWRAVSGLFYARPPGTKPGSGRLVHGEDPLDLRNEIIRAQAREDP
jgi:hypothetical protein